NSELRHLQAAGRVLPGAAHVRDAEADLRDALPRAGLRHLQAVLLDLRSAGVLHNAASDLSDALPPGAVHLLPDNPGSEAARLQDLHAGAGLVAAASDGADRAL